MSRFTSVFAALALAFAFLQVHGASAQSQSAAATVITIPKMCCGGCAKKVAAKLADVPGIGGIQPNVRSKTITVIAKPQAALSPRALWEAVEQAGQ